MAKSLEKKAKALLVRLYTEQIVLHPARPRNKAYRSHLLYLGAKLMANELLGSHLALQAEDEAYWSSKKQEGKP